MYMYIYIYVYTYLVYICIFILIQVYINLYKYIHNGIGRLLQMTWVIMVSGFTLQNSIKQENVYIKNEDENMLLHRRNSED